MIWTDPLQFTCSATKYKLHPFSSTHSSSLALTSPLCFWHFIFKFPLFIQGTISLSLSLANSQSFLFHLQMLLPDYAYVLGSDPHLRKTNILKGGGSVWGVGRCCVQKQSQTFLWEISLNDVAGSPSSSLPSYG